MGRSRLRASMMRSPSCASNAKDPSIPRTPSASSLRRASRPSDAVRPQSRCESSGIRLMTREIGVCCSMRKKYVAYSAAATAVICLTAACHRENGGPALFKILDAGQTGIDFSNTVAITDSLNVRTDPSVYNGAGVAAADFDNDGLPDIFFAGNTVSSRLYLNRGHMRFDDITTSAGVKTTRWATGVSTVDINNDGYLDIYVSVSGPGWT